MLEVVDPSSRVDEQTVRRVRDGLSESAPADWRNLAAVLAVCCQREPPPVLGIAGGQGAGKSTLAALLVEALGASGVRATAVSIDDFYRTRAERQALAETIHPLLATRGVPGTHDVELCIRTLEALSTPGEHAVPVFDKGADDRRADSEWPRIKGPVTTVVLEGWCLGAAAEPEGRLAAVNPLEQIEDVTGSWRRFVNEALAGPYARLWRRVAYWVYLRVPDMAAVLRWREQQEQALPAAVRMDSEELLRFVRHYERLTLWMFESMPERSNLVVELGHDHRVSGVESGGRNGAQGR